MTVNASLHRPAAVWRQDWLILVHSHLRWDWVWQRPQQILSRFAAFECVVFVEEPVYRGTCKEPHLEVSCPRRNVFRVVPVLPVSFEPCTDDAIAEVRRLVQAALDSRSDFRRAGRDLIHWFYSPMTVPHMLGAFDAAAVVYDCMDELSKFRFAPSDLPSRERMLLSGADVVFTGGRRLFEAKSKHHRNVHFFGCGVDAAHFGRARSPHTVIPDDIASLPHPVIGYFGVVDERIDYALLNHMARTKPDWSIAMIGPTAKVDAAELPQAPNLHWFGQRSYDDLPQYVKAFDVCMMPFALNEATEFINPTKTLEYMAAGKPIVSTPVLDVVRNFTPVVSIALTPEEYVASCQDALNPKSEIIAMGLERAARASWDSIVAEMRERVGEVVRDRPAEAAARRPERRSVPRLADRRLAASRLSGLDSAMPEAGD